MVCRERKSSVLCETIGRNKGSVNDKEGKEKKGSEMKEKWKVFFDSVEKTANGKYLLMKSAYQFRTDKIMGESV